MESLGVTVLDKDYIENKDLEYIYANAKDELEALAGHTILFAGANGFLGYYFVKSILRWNNKYPNKKITLYALDNFPSGIPSWLKPNSILKILKKDLTKFKLPQDLNFDYIIHAASIASPIFYRQFPLETINANVQGLYNILNYMVKKWNWGKKIKGLLFFSSSEIYGDPTPGNIPTPEDYRGNVSCTGPRACYDESKRFGETLCVNYAKVYNLPIKIVRPFNNYGPGFKLNDGRAIPDFANNILSNKDIVLLSQGSPTRTFCYIADAIVGYIKVLLKGKSSQPYNIGVEKPEISIIALAEKMRKIAIDHLNFTGKIIKKKSPDLNYLIDNPNRRCPQITKARKELGFNPQVTLDEGLTNTLLWFKGNIK